MCVRAGGGGGMGLKVTLISTLRHVRNCIELTFHYLREKDSKQKRNMLKNGKPPRRVMTIINRRDGWLALKGARCIVGHGAFVRRRESHVAVILHA